MKKEDVEALAHPTNLWLMDKDIEMLFSKLNELSIRLEELEESLGIRKTG